MPISTSSCFSKHVEDVWNWIWLYDLLNEWMWMNMNGGSVTFGWKHLRSDAQLHMYSNTPTNPRMKRLCVTCIVAQEGRVSRGLGHQVVVFKATGLENRLIQQQALPEQKINFCFGKQQKIMVFFCNSLT